MDPIERKALKRSQLSRLGPLDIRNVTPSIKDFTHAVSTGRSALAVVAEFAQASQTNIQKWVAAVDDASVSAIAVATEEPADVRTAAAATTNPVIMQDLFLVREQVYQARLLGADAVFLMANMLTAAELKDLLDIAHSTHMAGPVEVCTAEGLQVALSVGAKVLVIPAMSPEGRLDFSSADELLARIPRHVTVLVRGPFQKPADFETLRGRADGIWIPATTNIETFLTPLITAAEQI